MLEHGGISWWNAGASLSVLAFFEDMFLADFNKFQQISFCFRFGSWDGHLIDVSPKSWDHVGGNVISDPNPAERKTPVGDGRVARVLLDPAQYHQVRWKNLKFLGMTGMTQNGYPKRIREGGKKDGKTAELTIGIYIIHCIWLHFTAFCCRGPGGHGQWQTGDLQHSEPGDAEKAEPWTPWSAR